jgi:ABC-type transport system involved in multi-copper enzyme maturation permease subunit
MMEEVMQAIVEIAKLTFSDAIRNKIFYGAFLFLVLLFLTAAALASVTMGRTELMISDLGLGSISILGNLMAIVITIQALQQERESRTLYVLITRLEKRWKYIIAKFIGLAAVLGVQVLFMCTMLALCIAVFGEVYWQSYAQACFTTILEVWLVIAIALLFAQSSSLFLAILLTLAVDIAGRFTFTIRQLGEQSDNPTLQLITQGMYYILPNLEAVNLRNQAGYIPQYAWSECLHILTYGLSEIALLLCLCSLIFQRKNLS